MKFKVIGMVISVILIASMIIFMVFTNLNSKNSANDLDEYPSGLIEDLPEGVQDTSVNQELGLDINEFAPDFELQTLTGETVKLSDYKGKKIILNFWASWCPPCRVEMPFMQNYYDEYKDSANVEILAVNMTKLERGDKSEVVKGFVDEKELTFPILMDEDGKVMDLYRVRAYPTTYFLNTEGMVTDRVVSSLDEEVMRTLIENSN